MLQQPGKQQKGFTLIEVLISLGVAVMLFISLSGLSAVLMRTQRGALRDVRVLDNTRYAIESIARTLRTVNSIDITPQGNSPTNGSSSLVVSHRGRIGGLGCPTEPCAIQYSLTSAAACGGGPSTSNVLCEQDGSALPLPLIPPSMCVQNFDIFLAGRAAGDNQQSRATITLTVRDGSCALSSSSVPLTLTTTVSLRGLDIEL